MSFLSTSVQKRWPDSFASSERVKLTLRANAEEEVTVIAPDRSIVRAGFDAPTFTPTLAAGAAGGSLTQNKYVSYVFAYASSKYPFVDNGASSGKLYPYSLPSPRSASFQVTANGRVVVTVEKTTRSDVDEIWIFRTDQSVSSALAIAEADAGNLYYVGSVGNDGVSGSVTFVDSGTEFGAILQIDNYPAPQFWKTVYDGIRWWGWGNPSFDAEVTLDGTYSVTLSGYTLTQWFSGRTGQTATFDGITTGGYDGTGRFYFKWTSSTTADMYADRDLTITANVGATGTTKIHIQGYASTLYKSKPYNPFAWGVEDVERDPDTGDLTRIPRQYAFNVGNGKGTAIAVLSDARLLKLDTENPAKTYYLNLSLAGENGFEQTLREEDAQYSIGSHHSQFAASIQGQTVLMGIDAKNYGILQSTAGGVGVISDPVQKTLRQLIREDGAPYFFHGLYEPRTQLNCWWVKTVEGEEMKCDTMLWLHAPTGEWGATWDLGVSASSPVFDSEEQETKILVGTDDGDVFQAFVEGVYSNGDEVATYELNISAGFSNNPTVKLTGIFPLSELSYFIYTVSGNSFLVMVDSTGLEPYPVASTFAARAASGSIADIVAAVNTASPVFDSVGIDDSSFFISSSLSIIPAPEFDRGNTGIEAERYYDNYIFVTSLGDVTKGWHVVTDENRKPMGWIEVDGKVNNNLIVDGWLNSFQRPAELNGTFPSTPQKMFMSVIPCSARTYFSPEPKEQSISAIEAWATWDEVTTHSVQYFPELSDTSSKTFTLTQTIRQDGTPAMVWVDKNNIPSTLLTQFGLQFNEFGYEPFRFYNAVIKVRK